MKLTNRELEGTLGVARDRKMMFSPKIASLNELIVHPDIRCILRTYSLEKVRPQRPMVTDGVMTLSWVEEHEVGGCQIM